MADQTELDLPQPDARPAPKPKRRFYAGLSRGQLTAGVLILAAIIWGVWVTKELVVPKQDRIVAARLSSIVGEYVQAQARSPAPPAQVEVEMRQFMASLDQELQRRSDRGQVVLVGEAVLTKNVPDITDELKSAVYASGAARPQVAGPADDRRMRAPMTPAAEMGPSLPPEPTLPENFGAPMTAPQMQTAPPAGPPSFGTPGASVSTFGGAGGDVRQ